MIVYKTFSLPKSMPQSKRDSEVSKLVLNWLNSLGKLSYAERDSLRLIWFEESDDEYRYDFSVNLKEDLRSLVEKEDENR